MIRLRNDNIEVEILKSGAELKSMKRVGDDTEYIWTGDPAYWKRHAPVLFPIVGKVVNDEYEFRGRKYHLGQHGFARDMDFDIVNLSKNEVVLGLASNSETLELYPFRFELLITYTIVESQLSIKYTVKNLDDQTIYFSIGAHPGFNCPLKEGESFDDYYFEFEAEENAEITPLTSQGLLNRAKKAYPIKNKIIEINDELFKDDALVFDHLNSKSITLKSHKSDYRVQVDYEGFPFLGLWSMPSGAPFVCIEPWVGHADYEDFRGDFKDKEDQVCLDVLLSYSCEFKITI